MTHQRVLRFVFIGLASATLLAHPVSAHAEMLPASRLAIIHIEETGETQGTGAGRMLADLLAADLSESGRFQLVERIEISGYLDEIGFQGSGAVDPSTAVAVGRLVGADLVLHGSVFKSGKEVTASVHVGDVESGEYVLARSAADANGSLMRVADTLADALVAFDDSQASALLQQGVSSEKLERLKTAAETYRSIVSRHPRSKHCGRALVSLARLLVSQGDYLKAMEYADDAVDTFPLSDSTEDALFYAGEARYFAAFGGGQVADVLANVERYLAEREGREGDAYESIRTRASLARGARVCYESLLSQYPTTRHKTTVDERLGEIASHGGL